MKFFSFTNIVAFFRLIFSPLVFPVLLVYLLPYNIVWINGLLAILFVLFSITSFFDGYMARKLKQETKLGRFINPIADHFLSFSTLIALLAVNKIFFYWVIILIGRPLSIMSLRIIALENDFPAPGSFWNKISHLAQTVFLAFVIANPYQKEGLKHMANRTELALLVVALFFALLATEKYVDSFIKQYKRRKAQEEEGI